MAAAEVRVVEKLQIVEELGAGSLVLPDYVHRGLAANERVKYYLTLLQTAKLHADDPSAEFSNLRNEREAGRVDDPSLDTVVAGSYTTAGGYFIPRAGDIYGCLVSDIDKIIQPLEAAAGRRIDVTYRTCRIGGRVCAEGDTISLDGESGAIYAGRLGVERERPEEALRQVRSWRKRPAVATS